MVIFKVCTKCGVKKPLNEYTSNSNCKDGKASSCKNCQAKQSKQWREDNPDKAKKAQDDYKAKNPNGHRQGHLRKTYGMELVDYDNLLAAQDGKCAICGVTESDSAKKFLCVDHLKDTVKVRGLLCSRCNSAIGLLKHSPELLRVAAEYVEKEPVFEGRLVPQGVHRT